MNNLEELFKSNFKFNKKFGQNFIFDTNLLKAIVLDSGVDKDTEVLEIGTGAGTLTKIISQHCKRVVSFEIDENLTNYLTNKFKDTSNIELVFKDIMKEDIRDIENRFEGDYILIANLPYYITTPIIFKFIEKAKKVTSMVIMVQQEVADRICATSGSKNYGAITPAIDYRGDAKIIRKVNRKMFTPPPNVDSAILKITINKDKYNVINRDILDKVIRSAFAMRRKTLENNLKTSFAFSSEEVSQLFTTCAIPSGVRGEMLTTIDFVNLANEIARRK